MLVGILAFQGNIAEHSAVLRPLGVDVKEVRSSDDLSTLTHLILPGGESTVIARFLEETGVGNRIRERAKDGSLALFGTCAGAILLATEATGKNAPNSLGLIDITVDRNAYGTQRDSFECKLSVTGIDDPVKTSFIRAPRITRVGQDVVVLASYNGDPVLVQSGRILAGTSHPEMRHETAIHQLFLSL